MDPVNNSDLSTCVVPTGPGSTMPFNAVFPVVHTPYYFYKEFIR
jgi:hypothetical protein